LLFEAVLLFVSASNARSFLRVFVLFGVLLNILLQADTHKALLLLFFELLQDELNQAFMSLSLEVSPVSALHDLVLVQSDEVQTIPLQLFSIVSVSNQQDIEDILHIDILLDVTGTNVNESRENKVVSKDQKLEEECCILLSDVEVV
jgi:hypothetical protein